MKERIHPGLVGEDTVTVTEEMVAKNVGSGDAEVLATPVLLNLIEGLCYKMIAQNLENDGETTVGTLANITHLAPTPVGMKVTVQATVTKIDRKKVTFQVEVKDEKEVISTGTHERFIVNRDAFQEKANAKKE